MGCTYSSFTLNGQFISNGFLTPLFVIQVNREIYGGIGMGVAACALVSGFALSNVRIHRLPSRFRILTPVSLSGLGSGAK